MDSMLRSPSQHAVHRLADDFSFAGDIMRIRVQIRLEVVKCEFDGCGGDDEVGWKLEWKGKFNPKRDL